MNMSTTTQQDTSAPSAEPREAHPRADLKSEGKSRGDKRGDIYQRVTDALIAALEAGTRPWMQPWADTGESAPSFGQPLRHNGEAYRGINTLLLWMAARDYGFKSSTWMTFKQAKALGASVRKGEIGSLVVFADRFTKTESNDAGEDIERHIPFVKGYTVFNVDQIEGLPQRYQLPAPIVASEAGAPLASAEAFFARSGADIRHGGSRAFYQGTHDFVQLPPVETFRTAEDYSATKAHELVHWTGHSSRNARQFGARFGDSAYAFEELVAEIGAAFLCADLGITSEVMPDHAAYLACWLQVLKQDKRAIFTAASQAQRAVDLLHSLADAKKTPEAVL